MKALFRVMAAWCLGVAASQAGALAQTPAAGPGLDAPPLAGDRDSAEAVPLYLLVYLNQRRTGLLAGVTWYPASDRIAITPDELAGIGLSAPEPAAAEVFLDQLPGLSYRYDEAAQELHLTAAPGRLRHQTIHGRQRPAFEPPAPGFGAVLNYRLTGNLGDDVLGGGPGLESLHAYLDGRLYAPFGVLQATGMLQAQGSGLADRRFRRHNTTFTASDTETMLTFAAGDIISSGQGWTRPIRMGGLQLRRDFSLRGDILTDPQLSFSGTALLPTAVDVYIGNVNAWSGAIPPGPYTLTDLPVIGRSGEAEVVIRDEAGNEERRSVSFFHTENLLRKGRLDFSIEAGVARETLPDGTLSYGRDRLLSASLRYGLSDRLTLHGHVEGGPDLLAASGGIATVLFNRAELVLGLGASRFGTQGGHLGHVALRTELAGATLRLSSTRHSAGYADLAHALGAAGAADPALSRPARAQDVLSLSSPVFADGSALSMNLINHDRGGTAETLVSGAYSRRLDWRGADLRLSGFKELSGDNFGLSFGLSMPLGKKGRAYAGLRDDRAGGLRQSVTAYRRLDREVGDYGYRVTLEKADAGVARINASLAWRARHGLLEGRLQQGPDGRVSASAGLEGALVLNGAGLLAGNPVHDSFAVVDLGVAGVPVKLNNRPVARTGPGGKALVPGLEPYQRNRISVDPADLPLNANVNATAMETVPARLSGTTLRMGRGAGNAALVVLRRPDGGFVPVGASVSLNGRENEFFVGYDGEVWLERLARHNRITVAGEGARCGAAFARPDGEAGYLEVTCE